MSSEKKKESEALRIENLKARENFQLDSGGAKRLMAMMCLGAVKDWLRCTIKLREIEDGRCRFRGSYLTDLKRSTERMKKECEEFFDSDIFTYMTGLGGKEETIRKLSDIPAGCVIRTIERGMKC